MRFLRSVWGITRKDRLENEATSEILVIYNLNKKTEEYTGRRKDHELSVKDEGILKALKRRRRRK